MPPEAEIDERRPPQFGQALSDMARTSLRKALGTSGGLRCLLYGVTTVEGT